MDESKRYHQYMYSYPHKSAYMDLGEQQVLQGFMQTQDKQLTLYLHIPFCSSKCGYCNLFSVAFSGPDQRQAYVEAVCRQIGLYGSLMEGRGNQIAQVVLGGGTPFLLEVPQFQVLFDQMEQAFGFSLIQTGFDIETSPCDTTKEKLSYLSSRNMRRISIGIQSFEQQELKALQRHHSSDACHRALEQIKKINPKCLNLDLIYGIPGQTTDSFLNSLRQAVAYRPDELFLYPLYIRQHTALYGKASVEPESQFRMYLEGKMYLERMGFFQTSMRRFVRQTGSESSCGFEQMLALGCGGRSYLGNLHLCEPYEVEPSSCSKILGHFVEKENFLQGLKGYCLSRDEMERRYVIKNLGYYLGVCEAEFQAEFGTDLWLSYRALWQPLLEDGSICRRDGRLMMTEKGLGESDQILARFISPKVMERMKLC